MPFTPVYSNANTVATILASAAETIANESGDVTVGDNLLVTGNLAVNGDTTLPGLVLAAEQIIPSTDRQFLSEGAQTINGIKTFTSAPVISGVQLITTGTQTISGVKTFTSQTTVNKIVTTSAQAANDAGTEYAGKITGGLHVALNAYIKSSTASTSTTTGALIVTGGVGVGSGLYVAGGANISGQVTMGGVITFDNTTASTSATTGALVVTGGVGVGGAINTAGVVKTTSTTASTSATTGALVVSGGVGIGGDVNVTGNVQAGTLNGDSIRSAVGTRITAAVNSTTTLTNLSGNLVVNASTGGQQTVRLPISPHVGWDVRVINHGTSRNVVVETQGINTMTPFDTSTNTTSYTQGSGSNRRYIFSGNNLYYIEQMN